ncbi:DUF4260 domain-containing protein [Streptomyces sp. NBC_00654]|uniref:DUF4260 family protein n=1 Tax=Streptomyces sp. NBC_00654 TaxID=2975799 RepID=UPI002254F3E9|nr:DUF4260 family protein [Streptomyces sp. NBC_00654]MCX4969002.1 DUF4260 domain-containing protein [Streptomyces sp. NBC_00654]
MSATTTATAAAVGTGTAATTGTAGRLALARRAAWLVGALFWSVLAVMEGVNHGWTAGLLALAFFIAPDLTMLVGVGEARGNARGQLQPRAVPYYNTAHRALIPLVLLAAYAVVPLTWAPAMAALCGWIAHISYDRAFGYGLRTKEGFQRD